MLETVWFIIWGVAWAVYFMLDGFDLGLGALFPFLAKNETDKRVVINAMGPFWDGNEVWLITAGGVTFAAFPRTYAVMFSSLYTALLLLLFALILRGRRLRVPRQGGQSGLAPHLGHLPGARLVPAGPAAGGGLRQHLRRPAHRRGGGAAGQSAHPAQSLRPGGRAHLRAGVRGARPALAGHPVRRGPPGPGRAPWPAGSGWRRPPWRWGSWP